MAKIRFRAGEAWTRNTELNALRRLLHKRWLSLWSTANEYPSDYRDGRETSMQEAIRILDARKEDIRMGTSNATSLAGSNEICLPKVKGVRTKPMFNTRTDTDLLQWLQDEQVDTIYMDDGRIIDVKSGNLRAKIREACDRQDAVNESLKCKDCGEPGPACDCEVRPR